MPRPIFKGPICRGSYLLNSACGHCERCAWERERMTAKHEATPSTKAKVWKRRRVAPLPWVAEATLIPEQPGTRFREHFGTWREALAWALDPQPLIHFR
jgi:hypothetical protein